MPNYIAVVFKSQDSDYSVLFPDFPGCVTAGETLDEAKDMAYEALPFHVEGMLERGLEKIPEPTSLDDILKNPDYAQCITTLVVPVPSIKKIKTVRVNISVPEDKLEIIDMAAGRFGMSRSSFLVDSAVKRSIGL